MNSNFYDPWGGQSATSGNTVFVQAIPNQVRGPTVSQWSLQSVMTENTIEGLGVWRAS